MLPWEKWGTWGAKKVTFTVCHSGKLKLTFTSPNIISTSPKNVLMSRLISQFFCNLNSSKNFTCPSGKLIAEFTSLIAKSTSPGLADTTFFARWWLQVVLSFKKLTWLQIVSRQTYNLPSPDDILKSIILFKPKSDLQYLLEYWAGLCLWRLTVINRWVIRNKAWIIGDIRYKQFTGETHTELFVVEEILSENLSVRMTII